MEDSDQSVHESVKALLEEAQPGEDASGVIRRKARAIVAKYRPLWTVKGPPFCPFGLADLEGIIVKKAECDIRSDGRIYSKSDQVYIEYTDGQSEERTRFTIFHELAHTLFGDCYKRERRRSATEKAEREFENLCNTAASEFLFPLAEFSADMGSGQLAAKRIRDLALRYHASVDATARRYVDLYEGAACVLFAEYREPVGKMVVSLFTNMRYPIKDSSRDSTRASRSIQNR